MGEVIGINKEKLVEWLKVNIDDTFNKHSKGFSKEDLEKSKTYCWVVRTYLINAVMKKQISQDEALVIAERQMVTIEDQESFCVTIIIASLGEMSKNIIRE